MTTLGVTFFAGPVSTQIGSFLEQPISISKTRRAVAARVCRGLAGHDLTTVELWNMPRATQAKPEQRRTLSSANAEKGDATEAMELVFLIILALCTLAHEESMKLLNWTGFMSSAIQIGELLEIAHTGVGRTGLACDLDISDKTLA